MIYLLKRSLSVALICSSSAFSIPTYWNNHPADSSIIQIRDESGILSTVQLSEYQESGSKHVNINGTDYTLINFDESSSTNSVPSTNGRTNFSSSSEESVIDLTLTTSADELPAGTAFSHANQPLINTASTQVEISMKPICWRISPKKDGYFEAINAQGQVISTQEIRVKGARRKLDTKRIAVYINTKKFRVYRHPGDKKNIQEHGIDFNLDANVYSKKLSFTFDQITYPSQAELERASRLGKRPTPQWRNHTSLPKRLCTPTPAQEMSLGDWFKNPVLREAAARKAEAAHEAEEELMAKAVSWRIHPLNNSLLQLLDENNQETHCFQTADFKNKITWNGALEVNSKYNSYYFFRHNKDMIKLNILGFKNSKSCKYVSEKSTYDMIDFEQIKSWRTKPEDAETIQFLNEMNEVMHEEPMVTASGEREIIRDTIEFSSNGKQYYIKKFKPLPATADTLQAMWEDSDTEEEDYNSEAELLMIDEDSE